MNEILAAVILTVCVVMLLRLALPAHWRAKVDQGWRRAWQRLRQRRRGTPTAPRRPLSEQEAARMAEEAIRRARERQRGESAQRKEGGRWDGNVFRLRGDKRPRKPH